MSRHHATEISLSEIPSGESVTLRRFNPQKGYGFTNRLVSLGFTPGVTIEMLQNYWYGPLVVSVRGTRVALGRQEAKSVFVERFIR